MALCAMRRAPEYIEPPLGYWPPHFFLYPRPNVEKAQLPLSVAESRIFSSDPASTGLSFQLWLGVADTKLFRSIGI
jgi:hypothetical protein